MLPKINHPLYPVTVPSTGDKRLFVPMRGRDEKILLMAKKSDSDDEVMLAVKQVVQNCSAEGAFDVDQLAIFDLELLFLRIMAQSTDPVVQVTVTIPGDEPRRFDVDLNSVEVVWPDGGRHPMTIDVPEADVRPTTIVLRHPPASLLSGKMPDDVDAVARIVHACVQKVVSGDEVVETQAMTPDELQEWLLDLSIPTRRKLDEFFQKMPAVQHRLEWKNERGEERTFVLRGLRDFFWPR
jgi:hypothetical protein